MRRVRPTSRWEHCKKTKYSNQIFGIPTNTKWSTQQPVQHSPTSGKKSYGVSLWHSLKRHRTTMYPQQTPNLCFPFPYIAGVHYGHRYPLAWIKLEKIYLRQYRTEASFLRMFSFPTRTQWRLQRNTLLSHVPKIGNGSESRLPE